MLEGLSLDSNSSLQSSYLKGLKMLAFFQLVPPSQSSKMRDKSESESSLSSKGAGVGKGKHTDQTCLLQEGSQAQLR